MGKQSYNSKYFKFSLLFHNGQEDPFFEVLTRVGIDRPHLQEGARQVKEAQGAQSEHSKCIKAAEMLQDSFAEAFAEARGKLVEARTLARVLTHRDASLQTRLHVRGKIPQKLSDWLLLAERFYEALAQHPALLQQVQHTYPHIDGPASVAKVKRASEALEAAKYTQRQAGAVHRQRFQAVEAYYTQTAGLARLALKNHRGYRTALGL